MGKGGCELAAAGIGCIRAIIGCLCFMCCIGPVMLIVGVVFLAMPNNFEARVSEYNAAIALFNNGGYRSAMASASGSANTVSIAPTAPTDAPLAPYFSSALPSSPGYPVTTSQPLRSVAGVELSVPAAAQVVDRYLRPYAFTVPARRTVTRQASMYCTSTERKNRRTCYAKCLDAVPSGCSFSYTSSATCYSSSSCPSCTWTEYQTAYCGVLAYDNATGFRASNDYEACIYPFAATSQPTSCSSAGTSLRVILLNEKDAFIQIQNITRDSSMSFGITAKQQREVGVGLIAGGLVFTSLVVAMCVMLYRRVHSNPSTASNVYMAVGRTYQPQPDSTMQANGGWGAQAQPAAGATQYQQFPMQVQQPGMMMYGQPQPQQPQSPYYGAPPQQPMYGQPQLQPANGQPVGMYPQQPQPAGMYPAMGGGGGGYPMAPQNVYGSS